MAARLSDPNIQFLDSKGNPLSAGKAFFYVTGTSTPATTYQDQLLVTPNGNPITLGSDGRIGNVFLDPAVTYKMLLQDSLGNSIFTADPITNIGAAQIASFQVFAGNPNGHIAGNAGTPGVTGASAVWDSTDQTLYICTSTGTTVTAVWSAIGGILTANEDVFTTTTNMVVTDVGRIKTANASSAVSFNLLAASTVGVNKFLGFTNINAGLLTISPNGGDKINNQSSLVLGIRQSALIYCTGAGWRILARGDNEGIATLTDGATPALDASAGNIFRLTSTQNPTIAVPSNSVDGQRIIIQFTASGGARTLSLNTGAGGFIFGSDIAALSQTVSGKTDYIGCIFDATANGFRVLSYTKGF